MKPSPDADNDELSLALGGPLYQLYVRCHLTQGPLELLRRRLAVIVTITWLPLALLALLTGQLFAGSEVPFAHNVEVQLRYLVSIPLLIWAELLIHQRVSTAIAQFRKRELIAPDDQPDFQAALNSAVVWRNSVVAEVILLVFAFTLGHWLWRDRVALHLNTWYMANERLTPAGIWYAFVSLPAFRFLTYRWYYRLLIWYRLLWQVSRLPLQLNPMHPDRSGGLGFLAGSVVAWSPFLLAHTVLLSGLIADHIWHDAMPLTAYKLEIVGIIAGLMVIAFAPLTFFGVQLEHAYRRGTRELGNLASAYVNEFRAKWITGRRPTGEPLLGAADIQSLADLANSYDVAGEMRVLPFGRRTVIHLAVLLAAPILPLTLTMIPVDEILDRILKLVL